MTGTEDRIKEAKSAYGYRTTDRILVAADAFLAVLRTELTELGEQMDRLNELQNSPCSAHCCDESDRAYREIRLNAIRRHYNNLYEAERAAEALITNRLLAHRNAR